MSYQPIKPNPASLMKFQPRARCASRPRPVLLLATLLWVSPITSKAEFTVTVLPETSATFPANWPIHNIGWNGEPRKLFTDSDDPLAPFDNLAVVFRGYDENLGSGGSQERWLDTYLSYRFRIDFDEEVLLNEIVVGAAGGHGCGEIPDCGGHSAIRLLDENRNLIGIEPLRGDNQYVLHTLDAGGTRGQTFFLEEFDYSTTWRYRDHISIDFTPVAIPEPSSLFLFAIGFVPLFARRRRRIVDQQQPVDAANDNPATANYRGNTL